MAVVTATTIADPAKRTLTVLYREAAMHWANRLPLYEGPVGMNYLPHFPILYTPFQVLPMPWGEVAWRWFSTVLFVLGWWRFARGLPTGHARLWMWSTVFGIAVCLGAVKNGQANLLLGATFLHAVASLIERRWIQGTLWILAGVAVKPIGLVLALLAPLVYRRTIRPLLGFGAGLALLPFAFGPPEYVAEQYLAAFQNLRACSVFDEPRFANFCGVLRALGIDFASTFPRDLAVAAGAGTAWLWWRLGRQAEDGERGLLLLALASGYLMLFNPMTEANSYVIAAPALAFMAVKLVLEGKGRLWGWTLVSLLLVMGLGPELLRRVDRTFALWFLPLGTLVFVIALMRFAWPRAPTQTAPAS